MQHATRWVLHYLPFTKATTEAQRSGLPRVTQKLRELAQPLASYWNKISVRIGVPVFGSPWLWVSGEEGAAVSEGGLGAVRVVFVLQPAASLALHPADSCSLPGRLPGPPCALAWSLAWGEGNGAAGVGVQLCILPSWPSGPSPAIPSPPGECGSLGVWGLTALPQGGSG